MFVLNREFSNVDKKYLLRLNVSPASKKIALFLDLTIERKKRGKEGRKETGWKFGRENECRRFYNTSIAMDFPEALRLQGCKLTVAIVVFELPINQWENHNPGILEYDLETFIGFSNSMILLSFKITSHSEILLFIFPIFRFDDFPIFNLC